MKFENKFMIFFLIRSNLNQFLIWEYIYINDIKMFHWKHFVKQIKIKYYNSIDSHITFHFLCIKIFSTSSLHIQCIHHPKK